ncbi:hypothetical protein [Frondihabitans sp. PAMC 28766]|uniref:hypothetical protein n=1 Tax=Frondihabitans sp. PAMC 28766 TaxID=1795630 RepID=UPI0012FF651B|nr:hypothetical protein [Frondihabitans sp. PAMC 28766]
MTQVVEWLAVIGAPASILIGGGAAYVRCRLRGELRTVDRKAVLDELRRQG